MSVTRLDNLFQFGSKSANLQGELVAQANEIFPETLIARWLQANRRLEQAGYGDIVVRRYARHSLNVAKETSPLSAIGLADIVSTVAIKSGIAAAEAFLPVAELAANTFKDDQRFISWTGIVARFASLAPESMLLLLERMDTLLGDLSVSQLEAWVFAGLRASGGDPERRRRFFSFEDPEAQRWLQREAGEVIFPQLERRLGYYLNALWGLRNPLREPPVNAPPHARRRSSFDRGVIRLPSSYPGYTGIRAEELYQAAVAHVGAHLTFSTTRYELAKLKPIQVAVISLIEDARVEQLAIRQYPGLRRLWLQFHIAQSTGLLTAPSLLARLARALIDPDFDDVDGFVQRGREMFFARKDDWHDPHISREIGNLLGNNLGQMRIQFNARTYVVEPPYRDDNLGLWNFDDELPEESQEAEQLLDSVRIEQQDTQTDPDREREEIEESPEEQRKQSKIQAQQVEGLPVARYPEFDYATGQERPEWTTIVEFETRKGRPESIDEILHARSDVVYRISNLISAAKVNRHERLRRQWEGDYIDIDAGIEAAISQRIGEMPDQRIYGRWDRRGRDLSVLLLLDVSESTNDTIVGMRESVLDMERGAAALLAYAMYELQDPFAIAAFSSDRRESVNYFRIKDFDEPFDRSVKSGLAGLEGAYSTRMGAAMRHAGRDLQLQNTHRKLLLVVSDGEPSDIDAPDPKYLVEDARKAVQSLAQSGIDTFCVGLDSGGENYLNRVFGRRNSIMISRLETLPEKLPALYLRLTA